MFMKGRRFGWIPLADPKISKRGGCPIQKGGPTPTPQKIAKYSRILGLKSEGLLTLDGKFPAKGGGGL
jgi:hypothetical protein